MHLHLKIAGLVASLGLFLVVSILLPTEQHSLLPLVDALALGIVVFLLILIPQFRQVSGLFVLGSSALLLGMFKLVSFDAAVGSGPMAFGVLLIEVFFALVIVGLAHSIALDVQALQAGEGLLGLAADFLPQLGSPIGREVVRRQMAQHRRDERPLSIILFHAFTVPAAADDSESSLVPSSLMAAYQKLRVIDYLRTQIRHPDALLLETTEGRLLILCPAAEMPEVAQLAGRLAQKVDEAFGFCPRYAVASFPRDGLTFNKILRQASADLETAPKGNQAVTALVQQSEQSGQA